MPDNNLWVTKADESEQGSFCDRSSHNHYDNVSDLGATLAMQDANDRGDEVIDVDRSDNPNTSSDMDDRFNLWLSDPDGQGMEAPARLGPGH